MRLRTARLLLRPLDLADCPQVRALVSNPNLARQVANIPHPYPPGAAAKWIAPQAELWTNRRGVIFGIEREGELIGAIGFEGIFEQGIHLGYWLGESTWGNGYMTEAIAAVVPFGFEHLAIERIRARCLRSNLGSARVLEKNRFAEIESRTKGVRWFERTP